MPCRLIVNILIGRLESNPIFNFKDLSVLEWSVIISFRLGEGLHSDRFDIFTKPFFSFLGLVKKTPQTNDRRLKRSVRS